MTNIIVVQIILAPEIDHVMLLMSSFLCIHAFWMQNLSNHTINIIIYMKKKYPLSYAQDLNVLVFHY